MPSLNFTENYRALLACGVLALVSSTSGAYAATATAVPSDLSLRDFARITLAGDAATDDPGLPSGETAQPDPDGGTPGTYVVQPGDTPFSIAEKLDMPLFELFRTNPDIDPAMISPGQELNAPATDERY